ncbi:MAG: hypothetical protein M0C28_07895 [Candidatus Moduliflexus flocculans]|nr:hypothetical protein [Candidatus Moduliflexus flocculans]
MPIGTPSSATLSIAPPAGGAPRALLDDCHAADYGPDGSSIARLCAWRRTSGATNTRLEKSPHEEPGYIHLARTAPTDDRVAFIWNRQGQHDARRLGRSISREGGPSSSSGWSVVTAARSGPLTAARSGTSASTGGRQRDLRRGPRKAPSALFLESPIDLTIHSIAGDGRALVGASRERFRVFSGFRLEPSAKSSLVVVRRHPPVGALQRWSDPAVHRGWLSRAVGVLHASVRTHGSPAIATWACEGAALGLRRTGALAVIEPPKGPKRVNLVPISLGPARSVDTSRLAEISPRRRCSRTRRECRRPEPNLDEVLACGCWMPRKQSGGALRSGRNSTTTPCPPPDERRACWSTTSAWGTKASGCWSSKVESPSTRLSGSREAIGRGDGPAAGRRHLRAGGTPAVQGPHLFPARIDIVDVDTGGRGRGEKSSPCPTSWAWILRSGWNNVLIAPDGQRGRSYSGQADAGRNLPSSKAQR